MNFFDVKIKKLIKNGSSGTFADKLKIKTEKNKFKLYSGSPTSGKLQECPRSTFLI